MARGAPVAERARRAAGLAAAVAAALLASCGSPSPVEPPRASGITLEGRTVSWTSSVATLGAVRWGRHGTGLDHVSYPPAAGREDRLDTRSHRVTLIGAADGDSVYLEVLGRTASGEWTAGSLLGFRVSGAGAAPPALRWTMVDVGFGDSHVLRMPVTGRRVMVDAGERRDGANVARWLDDQGIAALDAAMLTHIHEDHIGGFVGESGVAGDGVLWHVAVGAFLDTPDHAASRWAYDELLAALDARGIPRTVISAGETDATEPALAWDPAVRVRVLNAGGGAVTGGDTESDRLNNDSVVLAVTYGDVTLVLGGDAESPVQARLLAEGAPLAASVLKVHHHGVSDASDPGYLAAVNPRVGMIPIATEESYDGSLPSTLVLDRLRQRRVDVFASDRAEPLGLAPAGGTGFNMTVVTDGAGFEIVVERSRSTHYLESAQGLAARAQGVQP